MRGRNGMTQLVVTDMVRETPTIMSVRLEHPAGSALAPWQPGAHLDVQLVTRHERQYSLCGDPADVHGYRIAVRREPLSRGGSHYIHTLLQVGGRVWVRSPRNLFELAPASSYLLLAAGIGVTPILAMARRLAGESVQWRMICLARDEADVAFRSEIAALGEHARVHLSSAAGRLDLAGVLAQVAPGTAVYACGPRGFTDELSDLAPLLPEGGRLHVERFSPRKQEFGPDAPFRVVCARSGVTTQVPADRTMLGVLVGAGVPLDGSCLRGVCGSCAVGVLEGTPEHRDSLTSDDGSMTMYPCVSRSLTSTLVIDA